MTDFGDRVIDAVRAKRTPAMVGLDPRPDLLPAELVARHGLSPAASPSGWARAVEEFCCRVLDVVAPLVPAVKPQTAYFELHGAAGIAALHAVLRKARRLGLVTILDAKRGDIGSTSEAYAESVFGANDAASDSFVDALTVNPYLGRDSLDPFLEYARTRGRGVFVLVRTSNPGSRDLQGVRDEAGAGVWSRVAGWVREWSEATRGCAGYGSVGAVVGGTTGADIAEARAAMPHAILLVPGYGAQGATAADIAGAFDANGLGALVNSSRGVLFPNAGKQDAASAGSGRWEDDIERAARGMIEDLSRSTPAGRLRLRRRGAIGSQPVAFRN